MKEKNSFIISGILAISLYLFLITLLIWYFSIDKKTKPKHFVKKNIHSISVSLKSIPKAHKIIKKRHNKHKKIDKVKKNIKKKRKKIIKKKKVKKKIIKKKIIKKKVIIKKSTIKRKKSRDKNSTKKHIKHSAKSLFDKIKVKNKKSKDTQKKIDKDNGIKNAYFASIEEKLKDWPTQSNYAGERAVVWMKIETSGDFIFKIKSASANIEFNEGLKNYLKQLQRIGLGRHKGGRAYTINIEFIATN